VASLNHKFRTNSS